MGEEGDGNSTDFHGRDIKSQKEKSGEQDIYSAGLHDDILIYAFGHGTTKENGYYQFYYTA